MINVKPLTPKWVRIMFLNIVSRKLSVESGESTTSLSSYTPIKLSMALLYTVREFFQ
ncbi:MAG: hypothetical protein ACRYE7_00995 [Janthinobacterium lividum]